MIIALITGVPGYKLAAGEVQPVMNLLKTRLHCGFEDVLLRDVAEAPGAPSVVVTTTVKSAPGLDSDYPLVVAHSGPISEGHDICDALAHLDAGRPDAQMCPRALKRIREFKELAAVASTKPALNMLWAIVVPEQQIYWLVSAVREANPGVLLQLLKTSTNRLNS